MKLLVLCLLAALCDASRTSRGLERRKLLEVLSELSTARQSLQHSEQLLNTPPRDVEDCCCHSALRCYRANMEVHLQSLQRNQKNLLRSLNHHLTIRGLDFCNTGNSTTTSQACHSYPKEKVGEFFNRLESLIQKAVTNLSLG